MLHEKLDNDLDVVAPDDADLNDYNNIAPIDELQKHIGPNGESGYEIWFAGLNIDPKKAWIHVNRGELERLADGIYINTKNPNWMPPMTSKRRRDLILSNATRIASRIYSETILTGSSAYHCGQVDGYLCLANMGKGRYPKKIIGGVLTIYHSNMDRGLPLGILTSHAEVEDSLGKHVVECLPDEMLILQAHTPIRRPPPSQTILSLENLSEVITRATAKYGSKEKLIERLEDLAIAIDWKTQFRAACESIHRNNTYVQKKKNQFEYFVYWNKVRTGKLSFDGYTWSFDYDQGFKLKISLNGSLQDRAVPSFLGSILPEKGEIDSMFEKGFEEFRLADRYISNIHVRKANDTTAYTIRNDYLQGTLETFSDEKKVFTGLIGADIRSLLHQQEDDPSVLIQAMENPKTPRMSGMQIKLAGSLSAEGVLSLACDETKPFTHIIKPPPPGERSSVGTMEWMGMALASYAGLITEEFAIADMGSHGPVFIAERFDIDQSTDTAHMIMTEDFWSVHGLRNGNHKYDADLMDVARTLKKFSTKSESDGRRLFEQSVYSWLIGNSDMHLKNLLIIKYANEDLSGFRAVRLSPAYDLLCTNVYKGDPRKAALKLGNESLYTIQSFRKLGRVLDMTQSECDEIIQTMIPKVMEGGRFILANAPAVVQNHELSMNHIVLANALAYKRCETLLSEMENKTTNSFTFDRS